MKVRSIITAGQNTMRWARRCRAPVLAFLWAVGAIAPMPAARAEGAADPAEMEICFDYACAHQASARFDATLFDRIRLDLGTPAVVMPLAAWRAGEDPLDIQVSRP